MYRKLSFIGIIVGLVLVAVLVFSALFAGILTKYDPIEVAPDVRFSPPSQQHVLGTDNLGRDFFTRLVYGLRTSLSVSFVSTLIALVVGALLGIGGAFLDGAAGGAGRIANKAVICLARFLAAGPGILLAIIIAYNNLGVMRFAVGIPFLLIPGFIRVFNGLALCFSDKKTDMLKASGAVVAQISLSVPLAILFYAGMGYLGLGAHPPTAELGLLIASGREFAHSAPYLLVYPGLTLAVTALSFNILGECLNAVILLRSN